MNQASTDGLSSTRPHFDISYRPSSESVHRQKIVHSSTLKFQRPNSFMRWTICARTLVRFPNGRMDSPQTVVFLRGGLI